MNEPQLTKKQRERVEAEQLLSTELRREELVNRATASGLISEAQRHRQPGAFVFHSTGEGYKEPMWCELAVLAVIEWQAPIGLPPNSKTPTIGERILELVKTFDNTKGCLVFFVETDNAPACSYGAIVHWRSTTKASGYYDVDWLRDDCPKLVREWAQNLIKVKAPVDESTTLPGTPTGHPIDGWQWRSKRLQRPPKEHGQS